MLCLVYQRVPYICEACRPAAQEALLRYVPLPKVVSRELRDAGLKLSLDEAGTDGKIAESFDEDVLTPDSGISADRDGVVSLSVSVSPAENGFNQVQLSCKTPRAARQMVRFFDPRLFSDQDYISLSLEFLRLAILYNE